MKYAVKLRYDDGQVAYLDVKGRLTWKTKRAAQRHLGVCLQLMAKDRFFRGVVAAELDQGFFSLISCSTSQN
jgi:hypothetical protein